MNIMRQTRKILIGLVTLLILGVLFLSGLYNQVYAFNSDNYTSADVIFSDNLTVINSGNINIENLEVVLEAVFNDIYATILLSLFPVFLTIIAFWSKDPIFYIAAGLSVILLGFNYWTFNHYMSILIVISGVAIFARAFHKDKTQ
jgi:hypothetical protein